MTRFSILGIIILFSVSLTVSDSQLFSNVFADYGDVITTISISDSPHGIAFDSANNRMYVGNYGSNYVSVIDTSTNTVDTTISVGNTPYDFAFDSANNRMCVTAGSVSVIDTSTNTVSTTISVGSSPIGIAFDSANNRMYVANYGSDSVSVIDTNPAPNTVGTVTPTPGDTQVTLSWSAPSDNGSTITDYAIQYSEDNSTWSTFADGTSTSTSATVTGLTNGQQYYFKVAAVK